MMHVAHPIVRWIIYAILAWLYGAIVQRALKYDRVSFFLTVSIGAVGMILGKFIIPGFFNIHPILTLGGIPLISSLIGSFIIPGIMWLLRRNEKTENRGKKE